MKKIQKKLVFNKAVSAARKPTRSRAAKMFTLQLHSVPDIKNADGYPAFSENSLEFTVARIALCNLVKNQYYTDAKTNAQESLKAFDRAAKENPKYLLKAIKLARQNNLKLMVKLGIVALSQDDQFCKTYETEIVNLLKTFHPKQLLEYVELQKSKVAGKGFGSRQQRWVNQVIAGWSDETREYNTIKYKTDVKYLLKLAHYFPGHPLHNYVLDKEVVGARQKAFQSISDSKNVKKIATTMIDFDIPWDVCKAFAPVTPEMYLAFMMQAGTNAILLNLASYERAGVFNESIGYEALDQMLSTENIKKSRLLPIDILKPYFHVTDPRIKSILSRALTDAFSVKIDGLEGKRVAVSLDVSGSMNGDSLFTAGVLAYTFISNSDKCWVTSFDTNLYAEGSDGMPQLTGIDRSKALSQVSKIRTRGGTDTELSVKYALQESVVFDYFIIVTDEQQNNGAGLMKTFNTYNKVINKDCKLVIINPTNYPWRNVDITDSSVIVYPTVTPTIFKSMKYLGENIVDVVNKVSL